jgi:hypothetical protein
LIDAVSRNALKKFEDSILRYYNDAPEPLNDNELEQLKEILEFIKNVHEGNNLLFIVNLKINIINDLFLIRTFINTCN